MIFLPPDISGPFALGLVITSFFTSALTASFGLGGGAAMLGVLSLGLPVTDAVPVHGLVQLGSNSGRVLFQWRHIIAPIWQWFTLGSVAGIALGSVLVLHLPEAFAKWALALFILWSVYRPASSQSPSAQGRFYHLLGGALSSVATMLVGATGPLVAAWLTRTGLTKQPLVATHAACVATQHGLKIAAFGLLGFAYAAWAPLLTAMILSGLLGTWAGTRLLDRLPEKIFRLGFKAVMTALSLHLIWQTL